MRFFLKLIFFISDIFFLNLAIILSFGLSNGSYLGTEGNNELYLILFSNIGWIFLVLVSNPYSLSKGWLVSKIFKSQIAFLFVHVLIIFSLVVFFKKSFSITQIILVYSFFIPLFFAWKVLIIFVRRLFLKEIPLRNYILVGRNTLSEEIRKHYLINSQDGYRFKGYFDNESNSVLIYSLGEFCKKNEVHEIFYCVDNPSSSQLQQLVSFGLDSLIKVKLITGSTSENKSIQLAKFDQIPAFDLATLPLDETRNQFGKRIFDLIFSLTFSILVLSWLIPLIAILIKLDSKGPVFFIQKRNGKRNIPFGCFKFRTMVINQEADLKQASKNDNRITRVGKFLRKSSFDEFPQFINVVLGDMSIIGPRPHPIKLNEQFAARLTNIVARHYVKPGITGLAQCMGYRGETVTLADMENRVRLDRYYIENWSFWLDIKIIFLTVVSLLRGSEKAY